jgi:glycosyltransferase involved in cell wall biosynthesis
MSSISCIIPTYNEASRIANVLTIVSAHPLINEVIVVDDGSKDTTRDIVAQFTNVRCVPHSINRGKSAAIATGIKASSGDFLFFLDADLIGLTRDDVSSLIQPVALKKADVSISLRINSPRLWRLLGIDFISGERVLPRHIVDPYIDHIATLPGFGLEVFLNTLIIKNNCRIEIVRWNNVSSPYKYKKYGLWVGIMSDIRMVSDMLTVVSPIGLLRQIVRMRQRKIS